MTKHQNPYRLRVAQGETLRRVIRPAYTVTAARLMVRNKADTPGDPIISLDEDDGLAINEDGDEITLVLTATQTSGLAARTYAYDLFVTKTGGDERRTVWGSLQIDQAATR